VPRKYGLNWFMPALANRRVGSSCGTTGDDGTNVCPCFLQKKSMNCCRMSFALGITTSKINHHETHEMTRKRNCLFRVISCVSWLLLLSYLFIDTSERDAVFAREPRAILILWLARLHPHGAPRRFRGRLRARHFGPLIAAAAHAESPRLRKYDPVEFGDAIVMGQNAQHKARPLLLPLNGGRPRIERAGGEQAFAGVADHLAGHIVEVRLQ